MDNRHINYTIKQIFELPDKLILVERETQQYDNDFKPNIGDYYTFNLNGRHITTTVERIENNIIFIKKTK